MQKGFFIRDVFDDLNDLHRPLVHGCAKNACTVSLILEQNLVLGGSSSFLLTHAGFLFVITCPKNPKYFFNESTRQVEETPDLVRNRLDRIH